MVCLVINSLTAFAATNEVNVETDGNVVIYEIPLSTRGFGDFWGNFSYGTCKINNVPETGGYCIIKLTNVPGYNIKCTISGSSNLHYELEFLSSKTGTITTSNQILGNGSTTNTLKLDATGEYYVSVSPYNGSTSGGKLTLTFESW